MKPHRGVLILILGILGLVLCFPCGIAAWILGTGDLRQIDSGTMDPTGRGLTQAGKILGIIATILTLLGIVVWFVLLALGAVAGLAGAGR
jgi:hypothetical protein